MQRGVWLISVLVTCLAVGLLLTQTRAKVKATWDQKAAARYLDRRESDWAAWHGAARDHGTYCVSCHTAVPYALARPALRPAMSEEAPSAGEHSLIEDVRKRVELWNNEEPYYSGMDAQSRGTEAVLNALILSSYDSGSGQLSPDTRMAFGEMWKLQQGSGDDQGAWKWINFNNEPWEAPDSPFYGACLAAVATGLAPGQYSSNPAIHQNLASLRDYLRRESTTQPLMNQVALLWASARLPGVLSRNEQQSILGQILSRQQADGGWSLSSMAGAWKRDDGTPLVTASDGYATGLVVLVLEQMGLSREDARVKQGLSWLVRNQSWWGGHWSAYSLNRRRHDPFSNVAQFMDDAATAYAVLALTGANAATQPFATHVTESPHPEGASSHEMYRGFPVRPPGG